MKVFTLAITLFFSLGAKAVSFNISTNQVVAQLNFLRVVEGGMSASATFRDSIYKHPAFDKELYQLGQRFNKLQRGAKISWKDLPEARFSASYAWDLLLIQASYSTSIEDFSKRSRGILPVNEHKELIRLLELSTSYYNQIVRQRKASNLKVHLSFFDNFKSKMEKCFTQLNHFYNSAYAADAVFEIVLYPMPGKQGASTATPHGNVLVVGVFEDYANDTGLVGVMIHELAHSLFSAQSAGLQQQIDHWFTGSKSPYRGLAYNFIDEALATVTGNGWFMEQLTGTLPKSDWYNNTEINGYGKALYPLVKNTLASNRTIDSIFIYDAIKIFGKTFPESIYKFSSLFNNVALIADMEQDEDADTIANALRQSFRISGMWFYYPFAGDGAIAEVENGKNTLLMVSTTKHKENLASFAKHFNLKTLPANQNHYYAFTDEQGRAVVYINALSLKDVEKAVKKIYVQEKIEKEKVAVGF